MSTQHTFGGLARDSGPLTSQGATRITGKLLATQGYVVGIEISGSGSRQSVALADLEGKILYRARRPLEYVPDTETVLNLIDEMLEETLTPERLSEGRVLRVALRLVDWLMRHAASCVRCIMRMAGMISHYRTIWLNVLIGLV